MNKKTSTKQIDKNLPLVAIDFGSYDIVAMAATMETNGDEKYLRILGVEKTQRYNCVKNGIIDNTSDASYNLRELVHKLGNRIGLGDVLPNAFVSIGGRSMQTAIVSAKRFQGTKTTPVSKAQIESIEKECISKIDREFGKNGYVSLALLPYQYLLDDRMIYDVPTSDEKALNVVGQYISFIGKEEIWRKTKESFERTGINIEQKWVRPEALVTALIGEEDDYRGCAIIDMGDQTTSLSIYKGGHFLTSHTIPLGGNNITRDIEQLGMNMATAQKIKHTLGVAVPELVTKDVTYKIPSVIEPEKPILLKLSDLEMIISSRLDEIFDFIFRNLKKYEDQIEVIYITGGASKLKGIIPYIKKHISLEVQYGSHAEWLALNTEDEYYKPEYSGLIGTLILGNTRRETDPNAEPVAKNIFQKIKQTVEDKVNTLF